MSGVTFGYGDTETLPRDPCTTSGVPTMAHVLIQHTVKDYATFEWDDAEKAKQFAGGFELREAMERATSGSPSTVSVLEGILQVDA